jgi:hypothetical protein
MISHTDGSVIGGVVVLDISSMMCTFTDVWATEAVSVGMVIF